MKIKLFCAGLLALVIVALPVWGVGPHGGSTTYTSLPSPASMPAFMGTPFKHPVEPDWLVYVDEFLHAELIDDWTWRAIGAGTEDDLVADSDLGISEIKPGGANSGGTQIQNIATGVGAFIYAASGRTIIFQIRVKAADWDAQDMAFGISTPTGVSVLDLNGAWAAGPTDAVGFYANEADTGVFQAFYEGTNGGIQEVGAVNALFTDDEYHTFTVKVIGLAHAEWYVDGVLMQTAVLDTGALDATAGMSKFFANIGDAAGELMTADYTYAAVTR